MYCIIHDDRDVLAWTWVSGSVANPNPNPVGSYITGIGSSESSSFKTDKISFFFLKIILSTLKEFLPQPKEKYAKNRKKKN
jgi:hypothetical protein